MSRLGHRKSRALFGCDVLGYINRLGSCYPILLVQIRGDLNRSGKDECFPLSGHTRQVTHPSCGSNRHQGTLSHKSLPDPLQLVPEHN